MANRRFTLPGILNGLWGTREPAEQGAGFPVIPGVHQAHAQADMKLLTLREVPDTLGEDLDRGSQVPLSRCVRPSNAKVC